MGSFLHKIVAWWPQEAYFLYDSQSCKEPVVQRLMKETKEAITWVQMKMNWGCICIVAVCVLGILKR